MAIQRIKVSLVAIFYSWQHFCGW